MAPLSGGEFEQPGEGLLELREPFLLQAFAHRDHVDARRGQRDEVLRRLLRRVPR